jgi:hypothetical protein
MSTRYFVVAAALPLLLLQACAHQRADGLTEQMARTEAVLKQAESAGAEQEALPELQHARDKFSEARRELAKGSGSSDREAMRLAKEAEVDAQYAAAKAQAERQEDAASEVQEGVRALEDEAQRNAANPPPVTAN